MFKKENFYINIFIFYILAGECYIFNIVIFNFYKWRKYCKFYDYNFSLNIIYHN